MQTWFLQDGQVYGARPDERGPIGGGAGYTQAVVSGDYVASDLEGLLAALSQARSGETVYVQPGSEIDFSELAREETLPIIIPAGVTLAGSRGVDGQLGPLFVSHELDTPGLLEAGGPGVRITGFRIQGPDGLRREDHYRESFSGLTAEDRQNRVGHKRFYELPNSRGIISRFDELTVDNCELFGWSHAAVYLRAGQKHSIHHNYIHHNQRKGLGYGVCVLRAFALIEYNIFNYNRHSIAGTGTPPSGYTAWHNVVLGAASSHCFDMHGGVDRGDGTDIAGTRISIRNNTFYSYHRAIGIRGRPEDRAIIEYNWFSQSQMGFLLMLHWPPADTIVIGPNAYNAGAISLEMLSE